MPSKIGFLSEQNTTEKAKEKTQNIGIYHLTFLSQPYRGLCFIAMYNMLPIGPHTE